tara:strand:- start:759 stop:959 length:201 start_codon:yes stop_codon:yes gene_type:complete
MIVLEVKKFAQDTIEERFIDTLEDLLSEMQYLQEDDDMVFVRATLLSKDYTAGAILSEVGKLTESL